MIFFKQGIIFFFFVLPVYESYQPQLSRKCSSNNIMKLFYGPPGVATLPVSAANGFGVIGRFP